MEVELGITKRSPRTKNKNKTMTQEEKILIEKIYGKNFNELDVPTYIRNREAEELKATTRHYEIKSSYCTKCGDPILGSEPSICARCI